MKKLLLFSLVVEEAQESPIPAPTPAPAPVPVVLLQDSFNVPDGIITNEYAYWNPTLEAKRSPLWEMTSGSLFAKDQTGWTGVPDNVGPNMLSSNGNNSAVFRLTSRADFKDTELTFDLKTKGFLSTSSTPEVAWDGVHIFLRYISQYHLYYASINRRDNTCVIKKKVPGGTSNSGTYHDLTAYTPHTFKLGEWQKIRATVMNHADNSVTIQLFADGIMIVEAKDDGTKGGAPITNAGKVGVRGDNCEFFIDAFTIKTL